MVFSSPEMILSEKERKVVSSHTYKKNVCVLAFNEAHCLTEWYGLFACIVDVISIKNRIL